jgi:hypothetical protein
VNVALTVGDAVPDPNDEVEADKVALGERLPLTVTQVLGKGEADTEDESELHAETDATSETVGLAEDASEPVAKAEADTVRVPLGERLPSGDENALGEAKPDGVAESENQEGVADGDSVVVMDSQEAVADADCVPLSVAQEGVAVCDAVPVAVGDCDAVPHDDVDADMLLPAETDALDVGHSLGDPETDSVSETENQEGEADGVSVPERDMREGEAEADAVSLSVGVADAVAPAEATGVSLSPGETLVLAEAQMLKEGSKLSVPEGESQEGDADGVTVALSESQEEEAEGDGVPLTVGVVELVPLEEEDRERDPMGETLPPAVTKGLGDGRTERETESEPHPDGDSDGELDWHAVMDTDWSPEGEKLSLAVAHTVGETELDSVAEGEGQEGDAVGVSVALAVDTGDLVPHDEAQ